MTLVAKGLITAEIKVLGQRVRKPQNEKQFFFEICPIISALVCYFIIT